MKDLKDLEARYEELGRAIEELKQKPVEQVWPRLGDYYWFVNSSGEIQSYAWDEGIFDQAIKPIGNIFRTQADAEQELNARKVIAELRRQPGRKGFVYAEENWSFVVERGRVAVFCYGRAESGGFGQIYFQSQDFVIQAAKTVGHARILAASKWLSRGED